MLFNLERDEGKAIIGYIVPDAYSAIPALCVRANGQIVTEMEANEVREALVTAGRHETGRCGFRIDETLVPGLSGMTDLEIIESRAGVLIYRRPHPDVIPRKILRIETSLLPQRKVDEALAPHFQYYMNRIERLGRETVTQMLMLNEVRSQYISGKIYYASFEYFAEKEFETWIIVTSPYEALAELLLLLRNVRRIGLDALSERDAMALAPAIDFAEQLPIDDDKRLKAAFRAISRDVQALLSNLLVRQLSSSTPDEMPRPGAVATALDVMSRCTLVASREKPADFVELVSASLDLPAAGITPPSRFRAVIALAERFERTGAADFLVEKDIELYYYLKLAEQKASA